MALVTVQRSPSPSDTPDNLSSDLTDGAADLDSSLKSPQRSRRYLQARKRFRKCLTGIRFVSRLRLSESYLSFKGAALILPQSECLRTVTRGSHADIQAHLQSMFYLLRPQDTIKMAIKLDSQDDTMIRYMAVVTTMGVLDTEESVILGVDLAKGEDATIGLVLPVWGDMVVKLDGDGGFKIASHANLLQEFIFNPVSVQAMWSAWQCLNNIRTVASVHSYNPSGLTHTWIQYYKVTSSQTKINVWQKMEDLESQRAENMVHNTSTSDSEQLEARVRHTLREVMMTVDLEEVTSKFLRLRLEEELHIDLQKHKFFIDQEMIVILRQMDAPSQVLDYVYLGSEWNASNLDELQKNGIGYILNVTREIDNFFPGMFVYKNIRVYDVDESDLLKHWEETYRFIEKARKNKSKVLVHCKMGVSRSASTVMSYAMKYHEWSLDEAYTFVKSKRAVVNPNEGFMKQLKMYEGILGASNQRHNKLWRSTSVGILQPPQELNEDAQDALGSPPDAQQYSASYGDRHDYPPVYRPHSWSPLDGATEILLKASGLTSHESSEESSLDISFEDQDLDRDSEPIQFLLDADTSSQSVNEWDEAFHDDDDGGAKQPQPPVVLLAQRPRADQWECEAPAECESEGEYDESESRRVAGAYNVAMLAAAQDEFLGDDVTRDPTSLLHLHPDTILEAALARQRQHWSMSRLLMLHHSKAEPPDPEVITSSRHASTSSVPSQAVKLKPDNYWIKDEPPATMTDEPPQDADQQSSCDTESLLEEPGDQSPDGANTQYVREAIPWSPGTVRRHAQDLECRMTTAEVSDTSRPTSDLTLPLGDDSSASTASTPLDSPTHDDVDLVLGSPPLDGDEGTGPQPGHVLRTKREYEQRERSSSYMEMSPDKESRPVRRSASYKDATPGTRRRARNQDRFNRNSARRKTCLPVLTTPAKKVLCASRSLEDVSVCVTAATPEDDDDRERYQIGDDILAIERGKVRRRTMDYEGLSIEDPEAVLPPGVSDESDAVIASTPAVLLEGDLLIQTGSVQRTKQEIIQKYAGTAEEAEPVAEATLAVPGPAMKHSLSTPQLGTLAYPQEEEITWSVGTVKQHKEAFECITSDESPEHRLSRETLTLIQKIGTAWSSSPRVKDGHSFEYPSGPGMVKRFTDQIEATSASESIQRKLLIIENRSKVVRSLTSDMEKEEKVTKSMSRSASMREQSPRLLKERRDSSIGRSASLRETSSGDRKIVTKTLSLQDDVNDNHWNDMVHDTTQDVDKPSSSDLSSDINTEGIVSAVQRKILSSSPIKVGFTVDRQSAPDLSTSPKSACTRPSTMTESLASSPTKESKLARSLTKESKLVNSPTKESKLARSPTMESKLVGSPTKEFKLARSPTKESKLAKSPKLESKLARSPTMESKVASSPTKEFQLASSPTKESKLQVQLASTAAASPVIKPCAINVAKSPVTQLKADLQKQTDEEGDKLSEPNVKNLRGIFESGKSETSSRPVAESESLPTRERSKSSPEHRSPPKPSAPQNIDKAQPTEVQEIVSSLERDRPESSRRDRAVRALVRSGGEKSRSLDVPATSPLKQEASEAAVRPDLRGLCSPSPQKQLLTLSPDTDTSHVKTRKLHGKSHPLSKLSMSLTADEQHKSPTHPAEIVTQ